MPNKDDASYIGPQPLTIDEYKARQASTKSAKLRCKAEEDRLTTIPKTESPPKRRGGVRARAQRRRYIVITLLKENLEKGNSAPHLEDELKNLNKFLKKRK